MRKEINLKSLTLNDEQVSFEKAHLYLEDAEVDIGDENELISEHYIEWGIEIEQPDRQLDFSKGYSIELEGDDGIHRSGKCVVDSYENIGNRTVNASLYGKGVFKIMVPKEGIKVSFQVVLFTERLTKEGYTYEIIRPRDVIVVSDHKRDFHVAIPFQEVLEVPHNVLLDYVKEEMKKLEKRDRQELLNKKAELRELYKRFEEEEEEKNWYKEGLEAIRDKADPYNYDDARGIADYYLKGEEE